MPLQGAARAQPYREDLVEIFPRSGTMARIPTSAPREAILMRTAVEQTTARTAVEGADAGKIAQLHDLIERDLNPDNFADGSHPRAVSA